ncbi:MAG: thrombospondin type 3 repeat-containing protein [Ramlibacter sp.]
MIKKLLLATLIGASFGAIPVASIARPVYITVAPPPPVQEAVPEPRRGQIWVPGHHEWRHQTHQWVAGHWMRARRGYNYNAPHWVETNGRWHLEQGRWNRGDRDGDGVPNRLDNHPNNPNRS